MKQRRDIKETCLENRLSSVFNVEILPHRAPMNGNEDLLEFSFIQLRNN